MDLFYKPPLEGPSECESLENNYMNCIIQKAIRDRVTFNKCVIEHILWFHLECPRYAEKFDDPSFFKLRFRELFEENQGLYDMTKNHP